AGLQVLHVVGDLEQVAALRTTIDDLVQGVFPLAPGDTTKNGPTRHGGSNLPDSGTGCSGTSSRSGSDGSRSPRTGGLPHPPRGDRGSRRRPRPRTASGRPR